MFHVLFKQRLKFLMEHVNAPPRELEEAEREISKQKDLVKKRETKANEQERKLNQLLMEGLF